MASTSTTLSQPVSAALTASKNAILDEEIPLLATTESDINPVGKGRPLVFLCVLLLTASLTAASVLLEIPSLEVARYILCQSHYAGTEDMELIRLISQYNGKTHEKCAATEISKGVAEFTGLANSIESGLAFCAVLFMGRLSDIYGRKGPMAIVISSTILACLWQIVVVFHATTWGIEPLYLAGIVTGLFGAGASLRMLLSTMVCDCHSNAGRLIAMSYLSAVVLVGKILMPAAASLLLTSGLLRPTCAAICCLCIALLVCLLMPETHVNLGSKRSLESPSRDTEVASQDADATSQIEDDRSALQRLIQPVKDSFGALRLLGRGRNFVTVGVMAFLLEFLALAPLTIAQYLTFRFHWTFAQVGYLVTVQNTCSVLVLLFLMPLFTRLMTRYMSAQRIDKLLIEIGLVGQILGHLTLGLMTSTKFLPIFLGAEALSASLRTSFRVLLSNLVGNDEVGSMFAACSAVEGLGDMLGPTLLALIYASTLTLYPATVLIFVAAMYALGLIIIQFFRLTPPERRSRV